MGFVAKRALMAGQTDSRMTALKLISESKSNVVVTRAAGAAPGEVMMPKRQVWDRLFLFALVFLVTMSAAFDTTDYSYHLLHSSDVAVYVVLTMLTTLGLLGLADVIVNDILPEKYAFQVAKHQRQLIWMLIGITLMTFAYMVIRSGYLWASAWYIVIALRCVSVAFLDMHYAIKSRLGGQHA